MSYPTSHRSSPLTSLWMPALTRGLQEDGLPWDWTARGMHRTIKATLTAKSTGIWAAEGLFEELRQWVQVHEVWKDGQPFKVGDVIATIEGPAETVLSLERTVINLAAYVSGIATSTRACVVEVEKAAISKNIQPVPRVTATRKYLPGFRDLSIHAVYVGGGFPHRMALNAGVLIKENHIQCAGGLTEAVLHVRTGAPHAFRVEVEVRDERELQLALQAKAEVIMLDNFSPSEVAKAVQRVRKHPHGRVILEVSGGLRADTIGDYVFEGVDILSVGALTHSVVSVDLSLKVL